MVVTNAHRTTAIVIRHDGYLVSLVPMKGGRLAAQHLERERFDREWKEMDYDLPHALEVFLDHARARGATKEALTGLEKLAERDHWVASLF